MHKIKVSYRCKILSSRWLSKTLRSKSTSKKTSSYAKSSWRWNRGSMKRWSNRRRCSYRPWSSVVRRTSLSAMRMALQRCWGKRLESRMKKLSAFRMNWRSLRINLCMLMSLSHSSQLCQTSTPLKSNLSSLCRTTMTSELTTRQSTRRSSNCEARSKIFANLRNLMLKLRSFAM